MKTFKEAYDQFYGRVSRVYSADYRLIPPKNPQSTRYHKMRAKAITWELPPDPRGQTLSGVNFPEEELRDKEDPKKYKERAKRLKKMRRKREMQNETIDERRIPNDPPFVLNLKRINVRLFPNDVRVALYFNDQLKKYFSIAYTNKDVSTLQSEEVIEEVSEEDFLINLLSIFKELEEENQEIFLKYLKNHNDPLPEIYKFVLSND